jgi:hypothetical protein
LGFTTWRAVRRLTQVLRGRGAKRGELRGTACAGQGRASRDWGGRSRKSCVTTPPQCRSCLLYENRCYGLMWCDGHVLGSLGRCAHCAQTQLICGSAVRSVCAVKMSAGGNSRITAWRGLMASKGLSGAAPVLEGFGLSCEHDLSLLVQEDLNALSSQLTPFHSRILRTWFQGLNFVSVRTIKGRSSFRD